MTDAFLVTPKDQKTSWEFDPEGYAERTKLCRYVTAASIALISLLVFSRGWFRELGIKFARA